MIYFIILIQIGFSRYFQAGGSPEQVIELLSANYKAVAQMANLVAEWLILGGENKVKHSNWLIHFALCKFRFCIHNLLLLLMSSDKNLIMNPVMFDLLID